MSEEHIVENTQGMTDEVAEGPKPGSETRPVCSNRQQSGQRRLNPGKRRRISGPKPYLPLKIWNPGPRSGGLF